MWQGELRICWYIWYFLQRISYSWQGQAFWAITLLYNWIHCVRLSAAWEPSAWLMRSASSEYHAMETFLTFVPQSVKNSSVSVSSCKSLLPSCILGTIRHIDNMGKLWQTCLNQWYGQKNTRPQALWINNCHISRQQTRLTQTNCNSRAHK